MEWEDSASYFPCIHIISYSTTIENRFLQSFLYPLEMQKTQGWDMQNTYF